MASHASIPTFPPKQRDVDGNIRYITLPRKDKSFREHLLGLEHAPLEDEILDIKFMLYSKDFCDKLDEQPTTARATTAMNTAKLR